MIIDKKSIADGNSCKHTCGDDEDLWLILWEAAAHEVGPCIASVPGGGITPGGPELDPEILELNVVR